MAIRAHKNALPLYPDFRYDMSVIGIGKMGLAWALTLQNAGYRVCGCDMNPKYIEKLKRKEYEGDEPEVEESLKMSTKFTPTDDLDEALNTPLLLVMVQTPTTGGRHFYDHTWVSALLMQLNDRQIEHKHIVLNCTVIPGYIDRIGKPILKDCSHITLSYNPAFAAQGDIMNGYRTGGCFNLVIVGSQDDEIADILEAIYIRLAEDRDIHVAKMSTQSAEIAKLASNCFRTTKISFANMIGDIADRTPGADKYDISRALSSDKSIGNICITPGYGYGGPCYPRDNKALATYAQSLGIDAMIAKSADGYNDYHHDIMAQTLLDQRLDTYVFEDVCYKHERSAIAIIESSPKLAVAERLVKAGKKVIIRDRLAIIRSTIQEFGDIFEYDVVDYSCPVQKSWHTFFEFFQK